MAEVDIMENTKNLELEKAVKKNDSNRVHELLNQDADPNWRPQFYYRSLLHMAVDNLTLLNDNYVEIIGLLIQYGAVLDREEIKFIFNLPNTQTTKEVVHCIVKRKNSAEMRCMMFDELINSQYHVGSSAVKILEILLDHGLPIDEAVDGNDTPFYICIVKGKVDFLSLLLDRGADPNGQLVYNKSPLCLAAMTQKNSDSMVKLLLRKGASIKIQNKLGNNAFHQACECSFSTDAVARLLECGADVNEKTRSGETPLILAVQHRNSQTVKLLLGKGAEISERSKRGLTPLQCAVKNRDFPMVALLLDNGADVNEKKPTNGKTSLMYAVLYRDQKIAEHLLKNGANVDEGVFDQKKTALHFACESNQKDQVRLLLEYGASVNIPDSFWKTPLYYAVPIEIKKILIRKLAKLKYDNQPICDENLRFFRLPTNNNEKSYFENCLKELDKIKSHEFWNGLTMYDVFQTKNQWRKLMMLSKKKDFVVAFRKAKETFKYYDNDLDKVFKEAEKRRDILEFHVDKLYKIFKNYLPYLAIKKIAYFNNEHLFFDEKITESLPIENQFPLSPFERYVMLKKMFDKRSSVESESDSDSDN